MYQPAHFEEKRPEVLRELMRAHPLGTLVTMGADGLNANHVPMMYDPDPAPFGTLRCHVARANPVWREFSKEVEVLVVFQGPSIYISPSLYATKKETGKVVPTYNYAVIHAYGPLHAVDDAAWLRDFVSGLTDRHEAGRAQPWKITDAPEDYVQQMLRAIIGIEIPLTRLIGKWKVSQNRPAADHPGIVQGLNEMNSADANAMAALVKQAR
jgi:transcriptional regulator